MIVIRAAQLRAMRRAAWGSFADEMWVHMRQYFPIDCELMGEAQTRKVIQSGIERADALGFATKGEMCRYIDLSLSLGTDFVSDPQLPWVAEILARPGPLGTGDRMGALHARTLVYLDQVAGPRGERYLRAILRLRSRTFDQAAAVAAAAPLEASLASWLGSLYPEKWATFDRGVLRRFFALGCEDAARYELSGEAATLIHITGMFIFGSHFAHDPQFPWAAAILGSTPHTTPDAKARALFDRVLAHLEQVIALMRVQRA